MQVLPPPDLGAAPDLLGWLLGQSAALVIAGLWILTLLRQQRERSREQVTTQAELSSFRERNDLLSQALLRSIESASLERSKLSDQRLWQLDSTMRSFVGSLTQVLASVLSSPERLAEPSEHETE